MSKKCNKGHNLAASTDKLSSLHRCSWFHYNNRVGEAP